MSFLLIAIVFLLPSYFSLIFTKDDILRRLKVEEEVLAQREIKSTKEEIMLINKNIVNFEKNETRRRKISPIISEIANSTPSQIKLNSIALKKNVGSFSILIKGSAEKRDDFLDYVEKLKIVPRFSDVNSPLTNLLQSKELAFEIEAIIKQEYYKYDAK